MNKKTSAHPMITPLGDISPERINEDYPEDAAALYRIIIDNTVAYLKPSPVVSEERLVFTAGAHYVAVGWVTPVQRGWIDSLSIGASGYIPPLPIGSESPLPMLPLEESAYHVIPYRNDPERLTVDALLDWLDALLVASPGRIADLLEECIDSNWLVVRENSIGLISEGRMVLQTADRAGYARVNGFTTTLWRQYCDEYISGDLSLQGLIATAQELWGIQMFDSAETLESMVVDGHSAADAYALRDRMAVKRSAADGYPPGMNPQFLLSHDDPLRVERDALEAQLSHGYEQLWSSLSARERVNIRMGALVDKRTHTDQYTWIENIRFDMRWRWMIGLSVSDHVPDLNVAVGAYSAWQKRIGSGSDDEK